MPTKIIIDWIIWPTQLVFADTFHRHAINLPNMLFCDGHAQPFDLHDVRDPENGAVEGWNLP